MVRTMLALLASVLVLPTSARAMSGMQMSRDGHRAMINKDVGDERWVIIYDADDHTAMGNVFFPSGGAPAFVWCMQTGDDGAADPRESHMTFACYGADPCAAEPCDPGQWSFIDHVTLPGGFFMPPPHMNGPGTMMPAGR